MKGITSSIAPRNKMVKVGISNDASIEIVSGLSEGDQVVTKVISGTTSATAAPSLLSSFGGNRGAAGGVRAISR
jgi:hypothetical protein